MTSLLILYCAALVTAGDDGAIQVDSTKQLFLDDELIASIENVKRQIHQVKKHEANPVLWPSEPWEGHTAVIYGSVLRDGDKYRMWYHGGAGVSYAESDDGIRWTKPPMDFVKLDGQPTNTMIRRGAGEGEPNAIPYFYEIFGVHKDERETDPSMRYKMGFLSLDRQYKGPQGKRFHGGQRRGLGVAASEDGIHWRLVDNWATEAICDGATHWLFDTAANKFILYGRTKYTAPGLLDAWLTGSSLDGWVKRYFWGRAVARVESPDFVNWNITEPAEGPVVMMSDTEDKPGTEVYSMLVFPYESVYIGLVQAFHNRPDECHLDIQLAVSRDSVKFTRVGDRAAFLPCGPVGSWDRFNNSLANNPPIAAGDQLRIYYGGRTYRHSPYQGNDKGMPGGGIGFATIPRDRFVSLSASFDGGVVTTKPLVFQGKTLHLNAASRFGEIQVELLGAEGETVAKSTPIREDSLDIPVQWADGSLGSAAGPLAAKITLKNAHLYALWCTD